MKDDEPEPSEFEAIDVVDKVKIFSTTDEKLKFLGEILSNESSRAILVLLTEKEMSANDIAEKINLRLSLVIHHLNKMIQLGIVKVSRIGKSPKNHDVKFYSAKPGILIFPKDTADRAKKSKTLSNSLKRVLSYGIVGIAGITTWFSTSYKTQTSDEVRETISTTPDGNVTDFPISSNETITLVEEITPQTEIFIPLLVTGIVISLGLFLIWFSRK